MIYVKIYPHPENLGTPVNNKKEKKSSEEIAKSLMFNVLNL